jgi:hypothetical protein
MAIELIAGLGNPRVTLVFIQSVVIANTSFYFSLLWILSVGFTVMFLTEVKVDCTGGGYDAR